MGQQTSEEGEYGCDSCRKSIEGNEERFRCLVCKNYDLCKKCHIEKKGDLPHTNSHQMIKIFISFPEDCFTVIIYYLNRDDFQNLLCLNKFFRNYLKSIDHPIFEKYMALSGKHRKIPNVVNYIGSYFHFQKPFTPELAKKFPNLVILNINRAREVSGQAFSHLPKLRSLVLSQCYEYDGSGFQYTPNLKVLVTRQKGSDLVYKENMKYLTELEELTLNRVKITNAQEFSFLTCLKTLELGECKITDEILDQLFQIVGSRLEVLRMNKVLVFDVKTLRHLKCLKRIEVTLKLLGSEDLVKKDEVQKYIPEKCEFVFKRAQRMRFCL